jgi:hypothetical protein
MSALTNFLVQQTDPVTSGLLLAVLFYIRQIRNDFKRINQQQNKRLTRLENELIEDDT